MLKALQQIAILAMIAGSRSWKRLLTLSLMVFLAVITPWALSGCQPINIEAPPQPDVVTRALPETTGASDSTEEPSPSLGGAERTVLSPRASDYNQSLDTKQQPNPELSPPLESDGDSSESDASQTLDSTLFTAYDTLVEGEFFHTIPPYMNAGQQLVIRAGVSEEVNQKLLTSLNITATESVTLIGNERFNPLGMELTLSGAENDFLIEPISDGIKPVIKYYPEIWEWLVTPRKSGNFPLKLTALVQLDKVHQEGSQQRERELFLGNIPVRPVAAHTWKQIVQNYLIPFARLSFYIFCGCIGWLIAHISHANRWGSHKLTTSLQDREGEP